MIIIPKYTDLYIKKKILTRASLGGEFRLVLRDSMGRVLRDTGWFSNLITDYGLNTAMRGQYWRQYMLLGSDGTAAQFSDTSLGSFLGTASIPVTVDQTAQPVGPNYEFYETAKARFNAGDNTGTIRELGISAYNDNTRLAVRCVVSPPIVKNADNVLDVYYKLTRWPDLTDTTGTTTIASESYDYTVRASNVGAAMGAYPVGTLTNYQPKGSYSATQAFQDDIAAITSKPQVVCPDPWLDGNPVGLGGANNYWDWEFFWGLDDGNGPSGIRSFYFGHNWNYTASLGMQMGFYRVSDNAEIQKDATKTLTMQVRYTWTRH